MRQLAVFLLSTLALAASASAGESAGWFDDLTLARREAREHDRLLLVDLYAEWCVWCRVLEEKVYATEEFRRFTADRFVLLRVDTEDGGEGTDLQRRFQAISLPTTLVLTPELVKVGEIPGFRPVEEFLAAVEGQEREYAAFMAAYHRLRTSEDRTVLIDLADQLYLRGDGERAAALFRRLRDDTPESTPERTQLTYLLAESLRRGGDLEGASHFLAETERDLVRAELQGSPLAERVALLRFHIAHDRGACAEEVRSLESFLQQYPASEMAHYAQQTLAGLKAQGEHCT